MTPPTWKLRNCDSPSHRLLRGVVGDEGGALGDPLQIRLSFRERMPVEGPGV